MVIEERLQPYLEGAGNAVKFCGIDKGNEVLILCTPKRDRREVDAVAYAARSVGAHVSILEVEERAPNQPHSPVIMTAARGVDIRLNMGAGPSGMEKDGMIMASDYGVGQLFICAGFLDHDAARYPVDLWYEIMNRLKRRIGHTDPDARHIVNFRVVDANGSDFRMEVRYPEDMGCLIGTEPLLSGRGTHPRVCCRGAFPGGSFPWGDLLDSGRGVLVAEYLGRFLEPIVMLKPPLEFAFENGLVVDVQGGPEAERLKETLKAYPNANHLREVAIGTAPHIPLPLHCPAGASIPGVLSRAGNVLWGLGGDTSVSGTRVGSELFRPPTLMTATTTLYADDKVIVDNGRLTVLEEPELWESAKKYGDPAKLLTTV